MRGCYPYGFQSYMTTATWNKRLIALAKAKTDSVQSFTGDSPWVSSYHPSIWQIHRILNYKDFDPVTKSEANKTTIFSKRFLSKSFKRSFKEECCSPVFVAALDFETETKLKYFIEQNQALYKWNAAWKEELRLSAKQLRQQKSLARR